MASALFFPLFLLASADLVANEQVRVSFAELVKDGGYGWTNLEKAAFVVVDDRGEHRLVPWNSGPSYRSQKIRGPLPRGTVAIAHTHPRFMPYASDNDRKTARRLALPVFVLTPRNIVMVTPSGESVEIVSNSLWIPASDDSSPRAAPHRSAPRR